MSRKEKTDIAIGLIVVALALGFILYYTFSGDTSFLASEKSAPHYALSEMKIDDKTYSRLNEDKYLDAEESTEKEIEESDVESKIDSSEIDTIVVNFFIDTLNMEDKMIKGTEVKPIEKDFFFDENSNEDSKNVNEEEEEEGNSENELVEQKIIQKEKSTPSTNANKCIIVIGSYAVNKNSTKLKSRLKNEGYDIFETPFQGLNRIGIYTSCDSANLQRELRKMRSNYASDAVIFKNN